VKFNSRYSSVRRFAALAYVLVAAQATCAQPRNVTVKELVQEPNKFSGKEISVTGYFDQRQTHSAFICSDARTARSLDIHDLNARIFLDFKHEQLTNPRIKLVDRGYAHVVGRFEYKNIERKIWGGDKTNPNRVIVRATVGFGWGGVYSMQITDIKQFGPVRRPLRRNG